jgi:TP901 family phage tail tape measure protein
MAFNIAYTYQLIDKYTAPIQKIIAATRAHTRYLKENKAAIAVSNAALVKMTASSGKVGTAITRLSNRSERLNGSLKALQNNNAFDHLTTQAKGFNEQLDRMSRIHPNIPGIGPGGAVVPGANVPGGRHPAATHVTRAERLSRFGAAASGLTGIGTSIGITKVLKNTAAVENAMIDMGRATNLPAEELKKFEERFMSLSEQIGISTDKLSIMAFEGSKTGIDNADLDKYVKLTANAAVAFEILEDEAGRALGSIKAKMGLNIDQLTKMMDVTNLVADATSADGERMINILERLSGQFKTLKLSPEVAAGFAGVADQLETSPELAASGMNMMLSKLMNSSAIATKMLKAPEDTLRSVMKKYAAMPEAQRIAAINKAFGLEAGRFVIKLAGNMELFEETMKKAKDSKALGSMEREMQSKLKSLTMLWKNMSNAVTNVMVAIGEGLAPDIKKFGEYLREVTPQIRKFVREHPGIVKFAAGVALAVAAITLAVPVAWALGAAFGFVGAALALLSTPMLLAIGAAALIAWQWDNLVASGSPIPDSVNAIADSIKKLAERFGDLSSKEDGTNAFMNEMTREFDMLSKAIEVPLSLLQDMLKVMEWISGASAPDLTGWLGFHTTGVMAGAGQNIDKLTPPNLNSALSLDKIAGKAAPQQAVTGTITVKAEPGTDAKVSQPSLPTGSNLLMMKKQ